MSAFFASSTASHGQIWDVDIYVRASREDGDKEQSETISNQITMLTDFVHGRPELRLHEIRKDDGNTIMVVQKQGSTPFSVGQRVAIAGSGSQVTVSPR